MVCTIGILFQKSFLLFIKMLFHVILSQALPLVTFWGLKFTCNFMLHMVLDLPSIQWLTFPLISTAILLVSIDLWCFLHHILNSHIYTDLFLSCLCWYIVILSIPCMIVFFLPWWHILIIWQEDPPLFYLSLSLLKLF